MRAGQKREPGPYSVADALNQGLGPGQSTRGQTNFRGKLRVSTEGGMQDAGWPGTMTLLKVRMNRTGDNQLAY